MIEYNKINAKLPNLQISKLKIVVENNQGTTLRIGSKNFNSQDLPHELFLTQRQITILRNAIENNMSVDIKLSKAQIKNSSIWCFLGKLLGPLLKIATPLVTKALPVLRLSAASSAKDAGIQKNLYRSVTATLVISNKELDLLKIVQALEDQNILLKAVTKAIKNETKQQKGGFLSMLMGTLGASLLADILSEGLLSGKGVVRAEEGIKKSINFTKTTPINKY